MQLNVQIKGCQKVQVVYDEKTDSLKIYRVGQTGMLRKLFKSNHVSYIPLSRVHWHFETG